jgi:archaetidylinositol phosphate synthase
MVLDKRRGWADWIVSPLAHMLRHVDPNTITWVSFPFSIAAGVLYYLSGAQEPVLAAWLLFAALVAVGLSSLLDLLDGKVATTYGKTSTKGDYLDHVIDRFSDVLLFGGIALSGWVDIRLGFVAVVAMLLTSYLGTQAQAVGGRRNYGGILGRADRLAVLSLATALDTVRLLVGWEVPPVLLVSSALELMMWYVAAAGIITVVQRFYQGLRSLDDPKP